MISARVKKQLLPAFEKAAANGFTYSWPPPVRSTRLVIVARWPPMALQIPPLSSPRRDELPINPRRCPSGSWREISSTSVAHRDWLILPAHFVRLTSGSSASVFKMRLAHAQHLRNALVGCNRSLEGQHRFLGLAWRHWSLRRTNHHPKAYPNAIGTTSVTPTGTNNNMESNSQNTRANTGIATPTPAAYETHSGSTES